MVRHKRPSPGEASATGPVKRTRSQAGPATLDNKSVNKVGGIGAAQSQTIDANHSVCTRWVHACKRQGCQDHSYENKVTCGEVVLLLPGMANSQGQTYSSCPRQVCAHMVMHGQSGTQCNANQLSSFSVSTAARSEALNTSASQSFSTDAQPSYATSGTGTHHLSLETLPACLVFSVLVMGW